MANLKKINETLFGKEEGYVGVLSLEYVKPKIGLVEKYSILSQKHKELKYEHLKLKSIVNELVDHVYGDGK